MMRDLGERLVMLVLAAVMGVSLGYMFTYAMLTSVTAYALSTNMVIAALSLLGVAMNAIALLLVGVVALVVIVYSLLPEDRTVTDDDAYYRELMGLDDEEDEDTPADTERR